MLSVQHITTRTAVALVVGALAAPAASAMPIQGTGVVVHGRQVVTSAPGVHAVVPNAISRQDKRVTAAASVSGTAHHADPLAFGTRVPRSRVASSPRPSAPAAASGDAFDWGDAGIGGGGGLMLSIVAIGGGLVLIQRRPRRTGTTPATR